MGGWGGWVEVCRWSWGVGGVMDVGEVGVSWWMVGLKDGEDGVLGWEFG